MPTLVVMKIEQRQDGWHVLSDDGTTHFSGPFVDDADARAHVLAMSTGARMLAGVRGATQRFDARGYDRVYNSYGEPRFVPDARHLRRSRVIPRSPETQYWGGGEYR